MLLRLCIRAATPRLLPSPASLGTIPRCNSSVYTSLYRPRAADPAQTVMLNTLVQVPSGGESDDVIEEVDTQQQQIALLEQRLAVVRRRWHRLCLDRVLYCS
jgi:hypothetical protein